MEKRTHTSVAGRYLLLLFCGVLLLRAVPGHGQEIIREINAPGPEARGLAWDGRYLWCVDPQNGKVYQLDSSDGNIVSSFNITIDLSYGGLAWSQDDYIWLTNFTTQSWFYKVVPSTGTIVYSFHCPGG